MNQMNGYRMNGLKMAVNDGEEIRLAVLAVFLPGTFSGLPARSFTVAARCCAKLHSQPGQWFSCLLSVYAYGARGRAGFFRIWKKVPQGFTVAGFWRPEAARTSPSSAGYPLLSFAKPLEMISVSYLLFVHENNCLLFFYQKR
jgi:hypothetical protein